MKEIPLGSNHKTLIDERDYETLVKVTWSVSPQRGRFYALRHASRRDVRPQHIIIMHRLIWEMHNGPIPEDKEIDHINHDGLDNRMVNLRLCTRRQNNANQRKARGSSRFKGVTWDELHQKWRAQVGYENKRIYLGIFDSETEAAGAYDAKAKELFGEFAAVNFPAGVK